ncbi:MAG: hypothetical protein NTV52_33590 [Acidobacteria bacterium]|nr:hypothetical protein [Acidobacteriota bacterium]
MGKRSLSLATAAAANPIETPPLRFSTRWAPWYVALICAAIVSPFYAAYTGPNDEFTGIAIAISIPATYLLLQLACNTHRVRVYPDRIRVSDGPVPHWFPRTIPRAEIQSCYLDYIVQSSKRRGHSDYYLAGVVTTQSEFVKIAGPLSPEDAAVDAARQFAAVLDSQSGHRPLEIRWESSDRASSMRLLVAVWLALFLVAILSGAYWELSRSHRSADPRKLEMPL